MKIIPLFLFLFSWLPCGAMSVIPPAFGELVERAEIVAETEVKSVSCEWRESPQGRIIVTKVRLSLLKNLKGESGADLELVQIGGRIGDKSLVVADAPAWLVGDRDVVFIANNGKSMFPLVAVNYGRYPILKDEKTGVEFMTRANGALLHSVAEIGSEMKERGVAKAKSAPQGVVSLAQFEKSIADEISSRTPSTFSKK